MGLIKKNGIDYSGATKASEISVNVDGTPTILESAITDILGDLAVREGEIASTSHAVGDYILLGSKLYRVTSPISEGAAITVGTNVALTNAGDEMRAVKDDLWSQNFITTNGTIIPENADLDTYLTPGVYYSENAAKSATLTNAPRSDYGFKLIVTKTGYESTSVVQIAIFGLSTNSIWMRVYAAASTTSWSDWRNQAITDQKVLFGYYTTYNEFYAAMGKLPTSTPAVFSLPSTVVNEITGLSVNATLRGVITKTSVSGGTYTCDMYGMTGGAERIYCMRLSLTSSGATVSSLYLIKANYVVSQSSNSLSGALRGVSFWVTSGGEQLVISIPLMLNHNISTATLTRLLISLRVGGSYVGGSIDFDALPYVKTVTPYPGQGILYIVCEKTGGWGVSNNISGAGTVTVTGTLS